MKAKYFDYLNKYSQHFGEISQQDFIKEIEILRSIVYIHPSNVGISVQRLLERLVKELCEKNDINSKDELNTCINNLYFRRAIDKITKKKITEVRSLGQRAIDYNDLTPTEAGRALKLFDGILRSFLNVNNKNIQIEDEISLTTYMTFDRKLIYVQTADDKNGLYLAYDGLEKIGDASVPDEIEADFSPNSDYLRKYAKRRISQYMTTAGVPFKLQWAQLAINNKKEFFRDHQVHEVLKRSGHSPVKIGKSNKGSANEWFRIDLSTAKEAIQAVKEGREYLDRPKNPTQDKIELRPEQKDAIKKTKRVFNNKNTMLWNAKMRFGKTLTALHLIKEKNYKKVLIITHRPVVKQGWFDDFYKTFPNKEYIFGSREKGEKIQNLVDNPTPFVFFASLQDLRGSSWAGGSDGDKNREFLDIHWDLVVIDEAHEGNNTGPAHEVKKRLISESTKVLELSGTPFNLLDKYDEDNIFTWDYIMEQKAKEDWAYENPTLPNPYEGLPKVLMYTFELSKDFSFLDEEKNFNFKEFFRIDKENKKFIHEESIKNFLDHISSENKNNNYPFSNKQFRENLRHTLWLLPGIQEANALEDLLKSHEVFKEYNIVNVVKNGDFEGEATEDLMRVRKAISDDPSKTKTITLTVRKLTTGVTVPEWTGVLFLSNTTSPTSYLQAAFRAQTPFNHEKLGVKRQCYIFDFAPDRALKIVSESIGLTSKKGKINTTEQKEKLDEMLNFLPILGQTNNSMKKYNVDNMLTQLKRAYAEKAVRSGFEDSSLYNDRLLNLNEVDLTKFNELQNIVGTTNYKSEEFIKINRQGLDKEKQVEKKKKQDRTPEEEEILKNIRQLRTQRRKMISILKGVSRRIPLMIYGLNIDIKEDVKLQNFTDYIDDDSWEEFMPEGLTKSKFNEFTKYYDHEIFIEAGRIIRNRARSYDKFDYLERAGKIADLFGSFKNPDKETVLTPWKIVNRHLISTIGGLSSCDVNFENETSDARPMLNWYSTDISEEVYNFDSKILDINSKTGLYPLFIAISLFYKRMYYESENGDGKFNTDEIWKNILRNNIYVLAKTPMSKRIAERTLRGFREYKCNVEFIENLVDEMRNSKDEEFKKIIEERFDNVEFDVVIGNPPYQEVIARKETNNGQKRVSNIFQHFQKEADKLAKSYTTLIYPGGRWIHRSGKGMKNFGYNQINDKKLKKLIFFENANEVFYGVDISDGISIVLKDMNKKTDGFQYCYINNGSKEEINLSSPGDKLLVMNPKDKIIVDKVDKFVKEKNLTYINESKVINQKLFRIESDYVEKNPDKVIPYVNENYDKAKYIKLFANDKAGKMGRSTWFLVKREEIKYNSHLVNEWKVAVSSANAGGQKRDNQISIFDDNSAFGRSRVALKSFKTQREAQNFYEYATSSIIKFLFLTSDESLSSLGKNVPDILNYTDENSNIDFSKDVNEQLIKKLNLSKEDIDYINNKLSNIRRPK